MSTHDPFDPVATMRGSLIKVLSRQYDKGFAAGRAYERLAHEVYKAEPAAPSETNVGIALMIGVALGIVFAIMFAPVVAGLVS